MAVMLLSSLVMAMSLRVWGWRPGTPVELDRDSVFYASQVRSILDHGPWATNPDVGAPFGQVPGWFATGDDVHYLAIRALGLFSDSPFTVSALYFFLGFPLAGLTAYWLARQIGISATAAVVVGVLFSAVPAHQTRYAHLFLAAYWVVPLGMWLVITLARGRPVLHAVRTAAPSLRWRSFLWNARSMLIIAVVGLGGVYYAAFTLILLTAAVVIRRMTRGTLRDTVRSAGVVVLLGTVTVATLLRARLSTHGDLVTGPPPARRTIADTEILSGKPLDLFLPWAHHRGPGLARITSFYDASTTATVESSALGVVAAAGVVGLLFLTVRQTVRGRAKTGLTPILGLLVLVSLAFYVRGGLNSAVALFFTAQLRTWSRMFLLIALLGLLAVGLGLTRLQSRWGRVVGTVACLATVCLGVLDQTNPAVAPSWAAQRATVTSLTAYTDRLEALLPQGCSVFEAPVMRFPENGPIHGMSDYDPLKPSLTSHDLQWSYGAMRGTSRADWQQALPQGDVSTFVDDLAAAGFCALQVDHSGYSGDDPTEKLAVLLGPAIARSSDDRLETFTLGARRDDLLRTWGETEVLSRADQVLHPVVVDVDAFPVLGSGTRRWQWMYGSAALVVGNLSGSSHEVSVKLRVSGVDSAPRTLVVTGGEDGARQITVTPAAQDLTLRLRADPGTTRLALSAQGPAAPTGELAGAAVTVRLEVTGATVDDSEVVTGVVQSSVVDPATGP